MPTPKLGLEGALGLTPGHYQLDVQKAAAKLVIETAYDGVAGVIGGFFTVVSVAEIITFWPGLRPPRK
jgi:hypothetical protein